MPVPPSPQTEMPICVPEPVLRDDGDPSPRCGVTSAGVVYRRPLGDLVLRLCGEFGGQGRVVGF
jgi:hypothetical protein